MLDTPQRWLEESALGADMKLLLVATVRLLKQIVRSRSRAR